MARTIKPKIKEKYLELMEAVLAAGHIKHKYAVRLQTVINRTKGFSTNDTALFLGININTASNHVQRYNDGGIEALLCDKTRKPGIKPISDKIKNKLVQFACQQKPENETHWSTRELPNVLGSAIQRWTQY